ncbi:hypothetical protein PUNSTDRAFT_74336 [Punctularia strigosozonata HHB-11173 SS5]|uniref:uncharacterized protein n=1 Tax=Punctularia strigosozonata (strain HHB-11173) TaxID=741275 RepID=UPI00044164E8|nr:uncharacterized protein PUNSTDRAFT_74336 [Punctularia strigosozonata HHB-11173 SS5]EIN05593.1 hypothetical protein PUNSTDRAFT_74336 [Punctularia strigosozonata HHB-11173 SS5]
MSSLAGTASHHNGYVFLHSRVPPSNRSFPARPTSPLQRALTLQLFPVGVTVNWAWSDGEHGGPWRVHRSRTTVLDGAKEPEEGYFATAFSARNGVLELPEVTLKNVKWVAQALREHVTSPTPTGKDTRDPRIYLYVCTHGTRDCRCGDMGVAVLRGLREEISKRGVADRVSVAEVAHVGGHKYAANVLVYPRGDWLADVSVEDVPGILNRILDSPPHASPDDPPLCPQHWRGRMGLAKEAQLALYARYLQSSN